jgi:3-isopropylmalate/(R)-2-methylmalate dehydratase small subunit
VSAPFTRHFGKVTSLPRANVDTDQIIPKQFLKRVERDGFGEFLFYDWRKDPTFELNRPEAQGATILLTGANFGCGSSREHAVWALREYGFRAILAPSFADIFYANCCENGVLAVTVPEQAIGRLVEQHAATPGYALTVDLVTQLIDDKRGLQIPFHIAPYHRELLLQGLDPISRTLREEGRISEYEARRAS